jgi:hypothetical protein
MQQRHECLGDMPTRPKITGHRQFLILCEALAKEEELFGCTNQSSRTLRVSNDRMSQRPSQGKTANGQSYLSALTG